MKPSLILQELNDLGIRATKIRGQHFLIDEAVLDTIIGAAELSPRDVVVEIGPGLGILTSALVKNNCSVIAVELDHVLAGYLKKKFANNKVKIIEGDVRNFKNKELIAGFENQYKVVANIPYNITSELLQKFLEEEPAPNELVLLMQREVGERIIATPPLMNRLALLVQYFGRPEIIKKVSREAFWPPPKVESVVVRIHRHDQKLLKQQSELVSQSRFFSLVKAGFSAPRKKLIGNLSHGLSLPRQEVEVAMEKSFIAKDVRAEKVDIDKWLLLANNIFKNKTPKN